MGDLGRKTASVYINHQSAQDALIALQKQADALSAKIKKGEEAGKSMVKEIAKLNKVQDDIKAVQKQIDSGLRPSFNQLQATVSKLRNDLKRMSEDAPGYAEKFKAFQKANTELERLGRSIKVIKNEQESLATQIRKGFVEGAKDALISVNAMDVLKKSIEKIKDETLASLEASEHLTTALENAGRPELFDNLTSAADEFADTFKSIDNDDIIEQVFTKLVDYGKISENQIRQLTPVIIDYAQKEKVSLAESTDVMIQALNGKGKAIAKYGVYVKEGATVSDRFGIIINELGNKIKGAQEKFENGPQGPWAKFKQGIADIAENIGKAVLSITGFTDASFKAAVKSREEATAAQFLIKQYEDLSNKTNLTAAEKNKLKVIESDLVNILGESILQIDKQTGAYKLNLNAAKELVRQKLLLANNEAVGIASKILKAQDDEADLIKKKILYQEQYNAVVAETGITYQEAIAKDTDKTLRNLNEAERKVVKAYTKMASLDNFEIKNKKQDIQELTDKLNQLGFSIQDLEKLSPKIDPNSIINPGQKTPEEIAEEEKRIKDAQAELKRKQDELKRQFKELQKSARDLIKENNKELDKLLLTPFDLAIKTAKEEYAKDAELYKKALDRKAITLEEYNAAIDASQKIRDQKITNAYKTLQEELVKFQQELTAEAIKEAEERNRIIAEAEQEETQREIDEEAAKQAKLARYRQRAQYASGRERLNIELQVLEQERKMALEATDLTEKEKLNIVKYYEKLKQQMVREFITNQIDQVITLAQSALDIANSINDTLKAKEDVRIAEKERQYTTEQARNKKLLDQKLIDQAEYDRRDKALAEKKNKEVAAIRKKEFDREKKIKIIAAILNGAQAITKTYAEYGFTPVGIISAALVAYQTAEQIKQINKQKPPEYAKGGIFDGPSHSQGGMPVYSRGRKVAELEGGEPILSRKTYRNNKGIIDALLYSSMYLNGRSIQPQYLQRPYQGFNFPAVNMAVQKVRRFETGGIFQDPETGSVNNIDMERMMNALMAKLDQPIAAYVVYSDVNAAAELDSKIKAATTLTRS